MNIWFNFVTLSDDNFRAEENVPLSSLKSWAMKDFICRPRDMEEILEEKYNVVLDFETMSGHIIFSGKEQQLKFDKLMW